MANGNPWFSAAEQTLPQYVPVPFNELMAAGQAVQNRYDTAMAGLDATATGLASIEARLPAHQQYVSDYANRFRTEADELLSRYNYNAADPQFTRELTRLRSRYQSDPNLRTIQSANLLYDANMKTRQKLAESGKRFIDTTGGATGIDPNTGRLTADIGTIRATNYDEDLRTMFRDTLQATINDGRGRITNEAAVSAAVNNLMAGGTNNPVLREGLQYYMSQGMSPEQAQQQLQLDIQREATSALKSDIDWGYDTSRRGWKTLDLQQQRLNFDQAKELAKQDRMGALIPLNSTIEVKNLNENLIKNVDSMLKGIDASGNLKGREQTIPATPENILANPGARTTVSGTSGQPVIVLSGDGEKSPEDIKQLEAMRTELGALLPEGANDRQVLETYKEYLKADNNAPTFWASPVAEIKDNITNMYFGTRGENLGDAIIEDRKGNLTRVASDKKALDGLKGFSFTGITTSPVRRGGQEYVGGAMKGTAVDDNGNIVTIYKPLPPGLAQQISVSSSIDRAIASGVNNETLKNDPSYRVLGRNIVPQKRGGRILLFEVDSQGNIVGDAFNSDQVDQLIQIEKQNISRYFSLHQNTD